MASKTAEGGAPGMAGRAGGCSDFRCPGEQCVPLNPGEAHIERIGQPLAGMPIQVYLSDVRRQPRVQPVSQVA